MLKKIPSPQDIGLPENIDRWRPGQEHGLEMLRTSITRHVSLCAPTGFGKSDLVVGDALLSKEPSCIVTATRGLQKQYLDQNESIGMVSLSGRNNYTCGMREGYTCEDGYAANCQYKGTVACPSSKAEMMAATSSLVVTNYAKWTAAKKFGQGMSHFKRVYFDEGHNAPQAIAQAMQVLLGSREIEDRLQINFPPESVAEQMEPWKSWAIMAKSIASAELIRAEARIRGIRDPKPSHVRHFSHMRNLCRRLTILCGARASEWVVEKKPDYGYQFDPVRPGRYAEATLFLRMPKVIMVSATLRPKTMYMCGVPSRSFTFKEFPSDFDPERSPIYYIPTMRVDKRAEDLGLLWARLDQIASKRRDRKGIIHTVSFARQQEIRQRSRFFEWMIINPKGEPATQTVEDFKASIPGTMLVSPSVGEGYDFPGDQCRWQFVCKIPFEPPSKIVKAREADDREYRSYQAMQALVQAFGRGMRSREDFCEGFICDEHLDWFLPYNRHLAPKWFEGFFKPVRSVPPPINF